MGNLHHFSIQKNYLTANMSPTHIFVQKHEFSRAVVPNEES